MKISIFSAFYPFRGGIAQFNARLYREIEKKHTVIAYTFIKQYPDFLFPGKSQFVSKEDEADKIPAKRIVSTFNPLTYKRGAEEIHKEKPDVFIANYWMSFFSFFLVSIAKKLPRKTKKVALIHNLIPHEKRFFDRLLVNSFVKHYDAFIVLSESVQKDLLAIDPKAKFIRLFHPVYDHFGHKLDRQTAQQKLQIDPQRKIILFFGLIRDYKGLDLLIQAFDFLDQNYQLLIVGEVYGSEKYYVDLIQQSSARERIRFINNYIPNNEVNVYFSLADLCVLPYKSATQSGVSATAFHFDVPVVATDVGGLKEEIGHLDKGVVVSDLSPVSLANGITEAMDDDLYKKLVQNILKEKELKSWEHFTSAMLSFIQSV